MGNKRFVPGHKKVQLLNALREVEEENRVGRYRTVPYCCARDKFEQLQLIDTDSYAALPKWQMHQTKYLIRSTKRYRVMTFHPSSLPPDRLETEVEKGLIRPVVAEDILVTPELERQEVLKLLRRYDALGKRILTRLGDAPQTQELAAMHSRWDNLLQSIMGDGDRQMHLYL